MKYTDYIKKTGLTNKEVVEILNPHFPNFTKVQCSMLSHPERYGIQLTAAAVSKLPQAPKKPKPKRNKPNRLVVYLDDAEYASLLNKKGEQSTQKYLEALITGDKNDI